MPYQELAKFYDLLLDGVPGEYWTQLIEDILKHWDYKVNTIAELGCGTGVILEKLADLGYKTYGVDISPEMLKVAQSKNIKNTHFFCQDIVDLKLPEKVDFIFAFHDCLNYLNSQANLIKCFTRVKSNLKEQGLFYFDLNRLDWLLDLAKNPGELAVDHYTLSWTGKFTENKFLINLQIYNKLSGKTSVEKHELTYFSAEEVLKILSDLNFAVLSVNHTPVRSFYLAIKGGSRDEG